MKFYTPLEQFEIVLLQPIHFFWIDISFTNSTVYLFLTAVVISIFYGFGLYKAKFYPLPWQSANELVYKFVLGLVKEQVGPRGIQYFPFIFLIFNFVLFSNLLGLLPFGFTTTGHVIITFTIALSICLGILIIGFTMHGFKFLTLFVPDAPKSLLPLIVVIEVVSYLMRPFSLGIRLFVNMMAGHTLLYILSSFVLAFINAGFKLVAIFPFVLILAVFCLELAIAFIQAYVFTILVCIYLNDSLNLH